MPDKGFLPVSQRDLSEKGWDTPDFIFICGDAYVDHPSFGHAVITRLLEAEGYRVGIISQPDFIVDQALADGRLVAVLPGWEVAPIGIHAVYTSRSHLAPKVRSFIDYLVECLQPDAARSD